MEEIFEGFPEPEQNWSKLPHALIEVMPLISTVAELKVILYILRHTWGYKDEWKRITTEEFMNGRKRKDGSRIDNGTGLTEPSIRAGLKEAVNHGFIEVVINEMDRGRVQKFYSLKMKQGEKDLPPEVKTFTPRPKKFYPRTEKETPREKPEIDSSTTKAADPFKKICNLYQVEIGGLSQVVTDMIKDDVATYPAEWIEQAVIIAVSRNSRKWSYVRGILKNWQAIGGPQNDGPTKGHANNGRNSTNAGESSGPGEESVARRIGAAFKARARTNGA